MPFRRTTTNLASYNPPSPVDQRLNTEVAEAEGAGIVAVARIQSGAFATSVALQNACMLSRAASSAFKVSPMGEEVYQAIFLAYGTLAVTEIQRLGFTRGGRS